MRSKISRTSKRAKADLPENDDLIVKRKGGGSIIDRRPLFSHDGEILYVVWKQVIRAYSTQTGDFVREFEGIDHRIAGIAAYPDSLNTIIGCSDIGELILWNCHNGLITKKLKLMTSDPNVKIRSFHLLNHRNNKGSNICAALVTYVAVEHKRIRVALFDTESGVGGACVNIKHLSDDYHVDIVGNNGDNLVAVVQGIDLHILDPERNLHGILHKSSRIFTCVAGHPDQECLATGDSSGRVLLWMNIWQKRPVQTTYHWHTLPVTEIAFSNSGSHMYTGGGECVLVKWTLGGRQLKSFLPRLPAPIKHLTIAPENQYVAIATLDNGIVVTNPQRKLTSVIQNFTWGVSTPCKDLFPAGLTVDPRTNCVVLNSRTGHVQFYNTHTKSLLYNVNITAQNLLTQERNAIIVNTEVTKIALNHDGTWMASVEQRDDKISNEEIRLKFWKFDTVKQIFSLNTSIELPHDGAVNALQFQPSAGILDNQSFAVTTGADKKFKLWNLEEQSSIHQKTKHWHCYTVGFYRNLPVIDAGFSMDGSLLGVGFGPCLTIWVPETNEVKCSLTHSCYPYAITRVEFGKHEMCHLVVAGSAEHIAVWNLLTLTVVWSVPLLLSTLVADPNSTYMAAFTAKSTLFIFTPNSSKPVYTRKNLMDDDSFVLTAGFVPHLQEKREPSTRKWQQKSQLFFLDSNQELLTLESASDMGISFENFNISENSPATAFSALLAAQTTTSKEQVTAYTHQQLGVPGKGMVQELLGVPAHTLPPMRMVCAPFILSLIAQAPTISRVSDDNSSSRGAIEDQLRDSGNESDEEAVRPARMAFSPVPEAMDTKEVEDSQQLISLDWSSFSEILPSREEI